MPLGVAKKSCWASRSHPIRLHLLGESLRGAAAGGKQLPGGGNKGGSHEVTARGILPELRLHLRILPPALSCLTPKPLMLEIKGRVGRNVGVPLSQGAIASTILCS